MRHNQFPHRRNQNGFYDSICGNCFVTIGSRNTEDELEPMEKAHICDQTLLDQRKAFHEAWKTRRLD